MAATLDGLVEGSGAVFEAKFMLPWSFSEEAAAEKHMAQLQHNTWVTNATGIPAAAKCQPALGVFRSGFRRRTPGPPPFSAIRRTPAASSASRMRERASSDTFGPVPVSARLTVGSDIPARSASCDWDHPSRPRAARICSRVITPIIPLDPFWIIRYDPKRIIGLLMGSQHATSKDTNALP
jgi:hypothetical protein